jgi:integrase/recombinase XerD
MSRVSLYVRHRSSRQFEMADPKIKYLGGTIFCLRYRINGRRTFETLPPGHDYQMALVKAKLREADLIRGVDLGTTALPEAEPKAKPAKGGLLLDKAIDDYIHSVRHKAESTRLGYAWTLKQFYAAVGDRPLAEIGNEDFNLFIDAMKEEGLSDRTISNRLVEVGSMLRHFELTPKIPKVKYVEHEAKAYRPDELMGLFNIGTPDDRLLWQFLLMTGMREMEAANATYDDVEFVDKLIVVQDKPGWKPKDFERREIPVPDALADALQRRLLKRGPGLIFPRIDGKVDSHMLRDHLRVPVFKAGLNCGRCTGREDLATVSCKEAAVCKNWGLHRFRKSYATLQHRNGVDARTIQKRLGHSSLETTLRYLAGEDPRSERSRDQVNSTFASYWEGNNYLTQ